MKTIEDVLNYIENRVEIIEEHRINAPNKTMRIAYEEGIDELRLLKYEIESDE